MDTSTEHSAGTGSGGSQVRRRKQWAVQERLQIVHETLQSGSSIPVIARRHGVNANQITTWRREYRRGTLLEQARGAHVPGREAGTAGLMRQRARRVGLAGAGCPVDQQVLPLADPLAGGEAGEQCAVKPAGGAVVDVLERSGTLLPLAGLSQPSHAAVFAVDCVHRSMTDAIPQ